MSAEPHTGGQKDYYFETDLFQRIEHLRQLDLFGMEYTEYNTHDAETDIDPDSNFLSIHNNCNYYTNEKYNNN